MTLVTGITGKTGKWFLDHLIKSHENIDGCKKFRFIIRKSSKIELKNNGDLEFEKFYGDLEDESFLTDAMKGVETVLHIAGIHLSEKVVKAALNNEVKWMILVHTTGIYSKYKSACSEYIKTENNISKMVDNSNVAMTILRPTMVYGSIKDQNLIIFIKMVDKLRFFPIVNNAKYPLQPLHEKDLGIAYFLVLQNEKITKNNNYDLSGKDPIFLIDMLKIIGDNLEKKTHFISIPFSIAYLCAYIVFLISFTKVDYREKVQRLIEPRAYPHKKASDDFDFSPVSFEEGIKPEVKDYLENKKIN